MTAEDPNHPDPKSAGHIQKEPRELTPDEERGMISLMVSDFLARFASFKANKRKTTLAVGSFQPKAPDLDKKVLLRSLGSNTPLGTINYSSLRNAYADALKQDLLRSNPIFMTRDYKETRNDEGKVAEGRILEHKWTYVLKPTNDGRIGKVDEIIRIDLDRGLIRDYYWEASSSGNMHAEIDPVGVSVRLLTVDLPVKVG